MTAKENNAVRDSKYGKAFRAAFPRTIPVMAGYLVLGFGFGLLLQSRGYSFLWAILMSVTIYGGSMQFVTVDLLSGGAGHYNGRRYDAYDPCKYTCFTVYPCFQDTGIRER